MSSLRVPTYEGNCFTLPVENFSDEEQTAILEQISKKINQLSFLNFSGCQVDETKCKYIREILHNNKNLVIVQLNKINPNDSEIEIICQGLMKVEYTRILHLCYNNFTIEGIKTISKLLKNNINIEELILGYNNINDESFKILAESLEKNNTLKVIDLLGNQITDLGYSYLIDALEKNYTLNRVTFLDLHWSLSYYIDKDGSQCSPEQLLHIKELLKKENREKRYHKHLAELFVSWCYCLDTKEVFLPYEIRKMIWRKLISIIFI